MLPLKKSVIADGSDDGCLKHSASRTEAKTTFSRLYHLHWVVGIYIPNQISPEGEEGNRLTCELWVKKQSEEER